MEKGKTTLRLYYPVWQGGMSPLILESAPMIKMLLPQGNNCETAEVPISKEINKEIESKDGVNEPTILLKQIKAAEQILEIKKPEKIITLGGDCSSSQVPFDYLHGKYGSDVGIIWMDAHPDISTPKELHNEHTMVLGNLLGDGAEEFAKVVKNKYSYNKVMYAGLVYEGAFDYEKEYINKNKIRYATPEELKENSNKIISWIKEEGIKYLCIHWDLDVLSPNDFRSIFSAEPIKEGEKSEFADFGYAIGKMKFTQAVRMISDVSKEAKLVGLTVAEYKPWDIYYIKNELKKIEIFND
jgi:arginase